MNLLPTFGFKGTVLPIVDNVDRFYLFVENENKHRVLLNIVSREANKFENIEPNSSKIIRFGNYNAATQLKIFYLGQELFDFKCDEIQKEHLITYSEYILKKETCVENVFFQLIVDNGFELIAKTNRPQKMYIQIVDNDKNEIVHEDNFLSIEPYVFRHKNFINYGISVYNVNGQKIYSYGLKK